MCGGPGGGRAPPKVEFDSVLWDANQGPPGRAQGPRSPERLLLGGANFTPSCTTVHAESALCHKCVVFCPPVGGTGTVSPHCWRPCVVAPCPRSLQPSNLAVTGAQAAFPVAELGSPTYHPANFGHKQPFLCLFPLLCSGLVDTKLAGARERISGTRRTNAKNPGQENIANSLPLTDLRCGLPRPADGW